MLSNVYNLLKYLRLQNEKSLDIKRFNHLINIIISPSTFIKSYFSEISTWKINLSWNLPWTTTDLWSELLVLKHFDGFETKPKNVLTFPTFPWTVKWNFCTLSQRCFIVLQFVSCTVYAIKSNTKYAVQFPMYLFVFYFSTAKPCKNFSIEHNEK